MAVATPRFSVGLPVFNGKRFIREAIESLLAQDVDSMELVISDNASTDRTEEISREYERADKRVRYVRHDVNRARSFNYNYVFGATTGRYFKWAAHDDLCAPTFVSRCAEVLDERDDVVLVYPRTIDINAAGRIIRHRRVLNYATEQRPSDRFGALLVGLGECFPSFGLIRRDALEQTALIGPYALSDRVLIAELALHGRFFEVPEELFFHRQHQGRSVKQHPARQRAVWFDTAKAGAITLPAWRQAYEFTRAIDRAPLDRGERLRSRLQMRRWVMGKWRPLLGDLHDAARDEVNRVRRHSKSEPVRAG